MKNSITTFILALVSLVSFSQPYEFEVVTDLETTNVISQGETGTCWSFATSSFLESEIMRKTGKTINLSEMYNVRNTYPKKAWNYIMRQGKAQFSEGGLAHDVINSVAHYGLVPESVYSGLEVENSKHNHAEMIAVLKGLLDVYIEKPAKQLSPKWKEVTENILDIYLGKTLTTFNYNGVEYTPHSFLEMTQIHPEDYITITSFTHQPFNASFILNIPDNFSNGSFLNVKLEDLVDITNNAIKAGYTIALDCDVSEKSFSAKHGIAVIPEDDKKIEEALTNVLPEKEITQALRQLEFENYNTTDDHLMHITGMLKDQNGTTYYKVKNSWGTNSDRISNNGYIYMSEAYFKLKTISIMVHKDMIPKKLIN